MQRWPLLVILRADCSDSGWTQTTSFHCLLQHVFRSLGLLSGAVYDLYKEPNVKLLAIALEETWHQNGYM